MLPGLVLRQGCGQLLVRYDGADRGGLRRAEDAGARPCEHRDRQEMSDRDACGQLGDDEGCVQEDAAGTRRPHEATPVEPVGKNAGRQKHRHQSDDVRALGGSGPERGTGDRVGQQREDEHAHPATELADGLADPQHGEVVVVEECPRSRHIRTITCASKRAQ